MATHRPNKHPRPRAPRRPLTRASSDRHTLYQLAVQAPEAEVDFVERTFRRLRGRRPVRLREDFCGTALNSCEWVRRRRGNIAIGLDLHAPTLAWGRRHNAADLTHEQRERLILLKRNVLRPGPGTSRVDAVLAQNFSWQVFRDRPVLLDYFRAVRASLVRDGLFILDIMGGWESMKPQDERRRQHGFTYVWRQVSYEPLRGEFRCAIDFEFRKGPAWRNAFTYHWRLYTIPEVRDALLDAGFGRVRTYWEGDDGKGGGNGVFREQARAEQCAGFIAYIVAER